MADKTVTVKPSGGTYTTLSAAIAGELAANADITAAGMNGILNIEIDGDWSSGPDTTYVIIDGFTTDSTHYINIYTASANRHQGKWSSSYYILTADGNDTLYIKDNYVRVTGLQIQNTNANGSCLRTDAISDGSSGVIYESCILDCTSSGIRAYAGTLAIRNCALHGAGAGSGILIDNYSAVACTIDNCTVVNFDKGLNRDGGTAIARNTYVGGCATTDAEGTITYTNCASSDATSRTGVTASIAFSTSSGAYFTNISAGSEDLHIGASSSLKDAGTDLSGTFSTDIDGVTRSGTWDIGADEYVAAAGGGSVPKIMLGMDQFAGGMR